jgi:hypothetical protein
MRGRGAATLLALGFVLAAASGCGSSSESTPTEVGAQRHDLVIAAHALEKTQGAMAAEVAATKAAWPVVAHGLPSQPSTSDRAKIAAAHHAVDGVHLPALFGPNKARSRGLTGPAASLAGAFGGYVGLSWTGWKMIEYALKASDAGGAGASFARANSPLYIESVYDGHFSVSQIGKKLLEGYAKLGGPTAFGSALTRAEVDRLAAAYSEEAARLHPHASVKLGS